MMERIKWRVTRPRGRPSKRGAITLHVYEGRRKVATVRITKQWLAKDRAVARRIIGAVNNIDEVLRLLEDAIASLPSIPAADEAAVVANRIRRELEDGRG